MLRMVRHIQHGRVYAWSVDLYNWNVSKSYQLFGEGAYSTNVTWSDNTVTTFYRRKDLRLCLMIMVNHYILLLCKK